MNTGSWVSIARRALVSAALASIAGIVVAAQGAPPPPGFPIAEFQAREQTARWLVRYDRAAWRSSDLVMKAPPEQVKKLGREWYCTEGANVWDCYFGKYDPAGDRYEVVFHFQSKAGGDFVRVATVPASGETTAFARALFRSAQAAPDEVRGAQITFNAYVRRTAGGQLEVWRLPAWQTDGTLIYGGDLRQTLDPTGATVLSTEFTYGGFRKGKPDRQVDLQVNNEKFDVATVGSIFFTLAYGEQFKSVTIMGRRYVTRLVRTDKAEAWTHVERPAKDAVASGK